MLDLKPCPFCGGEASLAVVTTTGVDRYRVYCPACGVTTWPRFKESRKAIAAWNRRTK